MKRLLAFILAGALLLSGCAVHWEDEAAPAEKIDKSEQSNEAGKEEGSKDNPLADDESKEEPSDDSATTDEPKDESSKDSAQQDQNQEPSQSDNGNADDKKDKFRFDEDSFRSYNNQADFDPSVEQKPAIDLNASDKEKEKAIIAIAWKELTSLYEISEEDYQFVSCTKSSEYHVSYAMRYGKDGFILGPFAGVTLSLDGIVLHSGVDITAPFANFDESSLDGITKEMLLDFADRKVKAECGERLSSYKVDDILLVYEKDRFVLRIDVAITDITLIGYGKQYYYEIDQ